MAYGLLFIACKVFGETEGFLRKSFAIAVFFAWMG
jgi:hypothetical protein